MSAGSFDSSVFSEALDGLKQEVETGPANPYQEAIEEGLAVDRERLAVEARRARVHEPAVYAKAKQLSPNLPPEIAIRNMSMVELEAKVAGYQKVFEKSPALQDYFIERPQKLAYANPDVLDELSGLDWAEHAIG